VQPAVCALDATLLGLAMRCVLPSSFRTRGRTHACTRSNAHHSYLPKTGSLCYVSCAVSAYCGGGQGACCSPSICFMHSHLLLETHACLFDGVLQQALLTAASVAECVLALLPFRLPHISTSVHEYASAQVYMYTPNPTCVHKSAHT